MDGRCMGTVQQGRRAGMRCKLDGTDRGDGWIGCGFHPSPPVEHREVDAEYVRIVVARLGELWESAPLDLRHGIEHSIVDLRRALGEVPT